MSAGFRGFGNQHGTWFNTSAGPNHHAHGGPQHAQAGGPTGPGMMTTGGGGHGNAPNVHPYSSSGPVPTSNPLPWSQSTLQSPPAYGSFVFGPGSQNQGMQTGGFPPRPLQHEQRSVASTALGPGSNPMNVGAHNVAQGVTQPPQHGSQNTNAAPQSAQSFPGVTTKAVTRLPQALVTALAMLGKSHGTGHKGGDKPSERVQTQAQHPQRPPGMMAPKRDSKPQSLTDWNKLTEEFITETKQREQSSMPERDRGSFQMSQRENKQKSHSPGQAYMPKKHSGDPNIINCDVCNMQFSNPRAYTLHTQGMLHSKKMHDAQSTHSEQVEIQPQEVMEPHRDESNREHYYCAVCDCSENDAKSFDSHLSHPSHSRQYLMKQHDLGFCKFHQHYPNVSYTLKDAHDGANSGPEKLDELFHKLELDVAQKVLYKQYLLRSGALNNYICKICRSDSKRSAYGWCEHVLGLKHRETCKDLVSDQGWQWFLQHYGDIPSPYFIKEPNERLKDLPPPVPGLHARTGPAMRDSLPSNKMGGDHAHLQPQHSISGSSNQAFGGNDRSRPYSGGPGPHSGGPGPHSDAPSPRSGGPGPHSDGPSPRSGGPGFRSDGPSPRSGGPGIRSDGPSPHSGGPRHPQDFRNPEQGPYTRGHQDAFPSWSGPAKQMGMDGMDTSPKNWRNNPPHDRSVSNHPIVVDYGHKGASRDVPPLTSKQQYPYQSASLKPYGSDSRPVDFGIAEEKSRERTVSPVLKKEPVKSAMDDSYPLKYFARPEITPKKPDTNPKKPDANPKKPDASPKRPDAVPQKKTDPKETYPLKYFARPDTSTQKPAFSSDVLPDSQKKKFPPPQSSASSKSGLQSEKQPTTRDTSKDKPQKPQSSGSSKSGLQSEKQPPTHDTSKDRPQKRSPVPSRASNRERSRSPHRSSGRDSNFSLKNSRHSPVDKGSSKEQEKQREKEKKRDTSREKDQKQNSSKEKQKDIRGKQASATTSGKEMDKNDKNDKKTAASSSASESKEVSKSKEDTPAEKSSGSVQDTLAMVNILLKRLQEQDPNAVAAAGIRLESPTSVVPEKSSSSKQASTAEEKTSAAAAKSQTAEIGKNKVAGKKAEEKSSTSVKVVESKVKVENQDQVKNQKADTAGKKTAVKSQPVVSAAKKVVGGKQNDGKGISGKPGNSTAKADEAKGNVTSGKEKVQVAKPTVSDGKIQPKKDSKGIDVSPKNAASAENRKRTHPSEEGPVGGKKGNFVETPKTRSATPQEPKKTEGSPRQKSSTSTSQPNRSTKDVDYRKNDTKGSSSKERSIDKNHKEGSTGRGEVRKSGDFQRDRGEREDQDYRKRPGGIPSGKDVDYRSLARDRDDRRRPRDLDDRRRARDEDDRRHSRDSDERRYSRDMDERRRTWDQDDRRSARDRDERQSRSFGRDRDEQRRFNPGQEFGHGRNEPDDRMGVSPRDTDMGGHGSRPARPMGIPGIDDSDGVPAGNIVLAEDIQMGRQMAQVLGVGDVDTLSRGLAVLRTMDSKMVEALGSLEPSIMQGLISGSISLEELERGIRSRAFPARR